MNRNTPGPWFVDPLGIIYSQFTQKPVVTGARPIVEAYANAKLMAGAPDLMAFTRAIQAMAKDSVRAGDPVWQDVARQADKLIFDIEGF